MSPCWLIVEFPLLVMGVVWLVNGRACVYSRSSGSACWAVAGPPATWMGLLAATPFAVSVVVLPTELLADAVYPGVYGSVFSMISLAQVGLCFGTGMAALVIGAASGRAVSSRPEPHRRFTARRGFRN